MLNKFKLMAMVIAIVSLAACSDSKIDENQPTGGNGGGSSKDYNINDKSFSQSNWRNQDKIYIFDQKSTDIKDDNGQTGYNTINLPWSSSVVNTNLPPNFCDAITPENGWELALNLCGDRTFRSLITSPSTTSIRAFSAFSTTCRKTLRRATTTCGKST